jgi:SH3 domain protein
MDAKRIALLLVVYLPAAHAQTMYITDEVVITLRRGAGTQFAIVDNLSTGDAVEVLERDDANGYARVRVRGGGEEGWVLTRYLVAEPTAGLKLIDSQRELTQARARIDMLESELAVANETLTSTQENLTATQATNGEITAELEDIRTASAGAIELRNQNEGLRRRNNDLNAQLEALTVESARLASRSRQNWFIVGALVLLGGIVIGLIAPSLRRRRRSDW